MRRRNLNLVLFVLLLILLVSTYVHDQDKQAQTPGQEFLELALACHEEYRPALEAMLSKTYNIFQITEGCSGGDDRLSSEILPDAVLAVRSREHGYEIILTPRAARDKIEWSCESTLQNTALACATGL